MRRDDYIFIFNVLCDLYPLADRKQQDDIRKSAARIEMIVGQLLPFDEYPWPDHRPPHEELA